ncbi:MAG: GTP-binding protein [Rhizobiaceae bacterium]
MLPIPVTVVTGFLGAGKTTLINRLLTDQALQDTAVIVNEFGEVAIDHLLVEQSSDDIFEIAGGCLCCTVRAELAETLADLIDRVQTGKIEKLSRIIIETTGMADPVPVLHAIQGQPALTMALSVDRVITVFDAVSGLDSLEKYGEARRQLAVADIVLVSKSQTIIEESLRDLVTKLERENSARIVTDADIEMSALGLVEMEIEPRKPSTAAQHPNHHHHHDTRIGTHIVSHGQPLPWQAVELFLDLLRSRSDIEILRIKGLVETLQDPLRPVVVHGVQKMLYPPHQLAEWPPLAARGTTLVIIGEGLNGEEIDRLFNAFAGLPQTDTPDRAAIEDNPLAIPGT